MNSSATPAITELTDLPNIGNAMARDLHIVGIDHPEQLIGKNGYQLYDELCRITDKRHDSCVIDVFLSVIDFMNGGEAKPWWKFTAERKEYMESKQ